MVIKIIASGSKGNCTYISDGETSLLLDAGVPISRIREGTGFQLSKVSAALVTHRHKDHSKAVSDLLKAGIKVYAPADVFGADGTELPYLAYPVIGGNPLLVQKTMPIGTMRIFPFPLHHDVPCVGFNVRSYITGETLVYLTDTFYSGFTFPRMNYLLCECNYDLEVLEQNIDSKRLPYQFKRRLVQSHMSIDTVLELLEANDLSYMKQIYLMHLSDSNSKADEFRRRVQAVAGCEVYVV